MGDNKENKKTKDSRPSSSKPSSKEESRNPTRVTARTKNKSESPAPSSTQKSSTNAALSSALYLSKRDKPTSSSSKQASKAETKTNERLTSIAESLSAKQPTRIASVYPVEKYESTSDKRKVPTSSAKPSSSQSMSSSMRSRAPSYAKSILKTTEDQKMASRQTKIESLQAKERKKQEDWAQSLIKGLCPGGVSWDRVKGGYRCTAKQHAVTDELVSEGKGGMFFLDIALLSRRAITMSRLDWPDYFGPYYRDETKRCPCGCGYPLWRLGDVKDKPKYLPEEHTHNGEPILQGIVYCMFGDKVPKEKFEKYLKDYSQGATGDVYSSLGTVTLGGFGGDLFGNNFDRDYGRGYNQ